MNKRGFAEGLSWFFAIVVVSLILILFYLAVGLLSKGNTQQVGDFYLGDFYKRDSLRQVIFMQDYNHQGVYNNFSYQIFEADYSFGTKSKFVLFLDSISKEIFSNTVSGVYPAFMRFSLGMSYIDWSIGKIDGPIFNAGPLDELDLVSKLQKQGINVAYQDIWDMHPENSNPIIPDARLYRIYFLIKAKGFVRFGTSAVQR